MKKFLIYGLLILPISSGKTNSTHRDDDPLKKEALLFALELVDTYFSKDCPKYFSMMADTVIILDGDGVVAKEQFKDKICKSHGMAVNDPTRKYQDYLTYYDCEIFSYHEYIATFSKYTPEYYNPDSTDYFFIGYNLKHDLNHINDFIWDDMFFFMVRKEKNRWVYKGASG